MNPSLIHNEEQKQMLQARFQVQWLLTAPLLPRTTYRFFNALVVEEGERRSLKPSSVRIMAAKWFLLLNTDKAWAHVSVFICVQDVCLIFTAPCFLPPPPPRACLVCLHLRAGREECFPGCCLGVVDKT